MTIQEFYDHAKAAKAQGAPIHPGIAAAQAALESAYGTSQLSAIHYNYFGIKGTYNGQSVLYPTKEEVNGQLITVQARFKSYPNATHCFTDYGDIIKRLPWYQDAEDACNVAHDFLAGLVAKRDSLGKVLEPGWATDSSYFKKVWAIAQQNNLIDAADKVQISTMGDGWKVKVYGGNGNANLIRTREDYKLIEIRRD